MVRTITAKKGGFPKKITWIPLRKESPNRDFLLSILQVLRNGRSWGKVQLLIELWKRHKGVKLAVLTPESYQWIRKHEMPLTNAFYDLLEHGLADWAVPPTLFIRISPGGKAYLKNRRRLEARDG